MSVIIACWEGLGYCIQNNLLELSCYAENKIESLKLGCKSVSKMFYIKPPNGQTSLDILEKCVTSRLEYLDLLYHNNAHKFEGRFEYLLENSSYDKIGHFMLRLLASTQPNFLTYWIDRETLLFNYRLNHALPRQLYRLLKSILYQIRMLSDREKLIYKTLEDVSLFFLERDILKHILQNNHEQDCNLFQCKVKYKVVPDLIRKREVQLYKGYAIILCSQWKLLLVSLFHTFMSNETSCMQRTAEIIIKRDIRLNSLHQRICSELFKRNHIKGVVNMENINSEVNKFPLCMQHLHSRLRATHRLSHYARLHYGLFLKDIGMVIEDALLFWKEEYSKPHSCGSICSHNWQSDEKKFVYSIRHLYGLVGSRKNYKSYNCEHFCMEVPSTTYEGGCPFYNLDKNILRSLLQSSLPPQECEYLINIISSMKPQSACSAYLNLVHKKRSEDTAINSPVQYYFLRN